MSNMSKERMSVRSKLETTTNAWPQKTRNNGSIHSTDNYESDEWNVAHARNLQEESKLIEAGFEYVRYSDKDQVAIYRKRK